MVGHHRARFMLLYCECLDFRCELIAFKLYLNFHYKTSIILMYFKPDDVPLGIGNHTMYHDVLVITPYSPGPCDSTAYSNNR
jgi:hypothetical protein